VPPDDTRTAPIARRAVAVVFGAGAAFATSGPLARAARPAHPIVVAGGRVALAAIALLIIDRLAWRLARGAPSPPQSETGAARMSARQVLGVAGAGLLLAAHFACFTWGIDATSLPAAISLISLEPLSVVLWAWALHRLRPTRLEGLGVATATAGALVVARGAGTGEHQIAGDLLVVAAVVLYGAYIAAARGLREALPARRYAALVYGAAAIALGVLVPFLPPRPDTVVWPLPPHATLAIAALALVPTLIGHTIVQTAARTVPPSLVALVSPLETLGGLAIGAALMHARPAAAELAGAAVIVAGVIVAIRGARQGGG